MVLLAVRTFYDNFVLFDSVDTLCGYVNCQNDLVYLNCVNGAIGTVQLYEIYLCGSVDCLCGCSFVYNTAIMCT